MFRFTVGAQSKPICVSGIREVPDSRPIGALIGHLSLGAWGTKRAKRLPTSSANIRTLKVASNFSAALGACGTGPFSF